MKNNSIKKVDHADLDMNNHLIDDDYFSENAGSSVSEPNLTIKEKGDNVEVNKILQGVEVLNIEVTIFDYFQTYFHEIPLIYLGVLIFLFSFVFLRLNNLEIFT